MRRPIQRALVRRAAAPGQHFRHAAYEMCVLIRLIMNRFAFQQNIYDYSAEFFVGVLWFTRSFAFVTDSRDDGLRP